MVPRLVRLGDVDGLADENAGDPRARDVSGGQQSLPGQLEDGEAVAEGRADVDSVGAGGGVGLLTGLVVGANAD